MSQPDTLCRALDKSRNICQHKTKFISASWLSYSYNAQVGRKRGERVIGNFGPCGSDDGQQGRFACVGIPDQSHIRDQAQFEHEPAFFAVFAVLCFMGCLVGSGGEMYVAQAPASASRYHYPLPLFYKVGD